MSKSDELEDRLKKIRDAEDLLSDNSELKNELSEVKKKISALETKTKKLNEEIERKDEEIDRLREKKGSDSPEWLKSENEYLKKECTFRRYSILKSIALGSVLGLAMGVAGWFVGPAADYEQKNSQLENELLKTREMVIEAKKRENSALEQRNERVIELTNALKKSSEFKNARDQAVKKANNLQEILGKERQLRIEWRKQAQEFKEMTGKFENLANEYKKTIDEISEDLKQAREDSLNGWKKANEAATLSKEGWKAASEAKQEAINSIKEAIQNKENEIKAIKLALPEIKKIARSSDKLEDIDYCIYALNLVEGSNKTEGFYSELIPFQEKLVEKRGNSEDYFKLGVSKARLGQATDSVYTYTKKSHLTEAKKCFEKALEDENRKHADDHSWLGYTLILMADTELNAEKKKLYLEGIRHFEKSIELDAISEYDDRYWIGKAHFEMACLEAGLDAIPSLREARSNLEKAVTKGNNKHYDNLLAQTYSALARLTESNYKPIILVPINNLNPKNETVQLYENALKYYESAKEKGLSVENEIEKTKKALEKAREKIK